MFNLKSLSMKTCKTNTENVKVTKELFNLSRREMLSVRGGENSSDTGTQDNEELE